MQIVILIARCRSRKVTEARPVRAGGCSACVRALINPASREQHRRPLSVRLPRQLDNSDSIPRRGRVNFELCIAANRLDYVLIVSPVPTWQTRILPNVEFGLAVKLLVLRIELGGGGESPPDAFVFEAVVVGRRGLPGCCDGL